MKIRFQVVNLFAHLVLVCFFTSNVMAQPAVGQWRDHFSYKRGLTVTSGDSKVYVSTANGVFWYNPTDGDVGKLNRVNGLSGVGISSIAYSPYQKLLLVGYSDGNIDMVFSNRVVNIPFIKDKPMIGEKTINHFYFVDYEIVHISTGFGIVVLNTNRFEIKDTYMVGSGGANLPVFQTLVFNSTIYAATESGLMYASLNSPNLFHFAAWSLDNTLPNPNTQVGALAIFKDKLIVAQNNGNTTPDVVWYRDGEQWIERFRYFNVINNLSANETNLIICSGSGIAHYQGLQGGGFWQFSYPSFSKFSPSNAYLDWSGNLAVADKEYGLMYRMGESWVEASPNGPESNNSFHIAPKGNGFIMAAGAYTDAYGNRWLPFTINTNMNNQWNTYRNTSMFDAVRVLVNPSNPSEYFASSWGNGISHFVNDEFVENYSPANSTLQTIISGPYCRVSGIAFDKSGNLWAANVGVDRPISVRLTDGRWFSFPYANQIGATRFSDIHFSSAGHLWLILPSGVGLFVLDPGADPTSASDDAFRKPPLIDGQGNSLPNDIASIAFDRDGYLWIGTTDGVLVSYNPERVFTPSSFSFQRVRVPDVVSGLAVFLLENEVVTTIAVDGGNRKWFGTSRSGAILQSADGTKQLKHFTTSNSPLPSNNIQHIAVHPTTGEVFISTDKGMVSYRGDATEPGETFGKVYAFPNPVRPNYTGDITITGLVEKTIVKITDISGNLVYETVSQGGQATWNGKNRQGKRVATGVYLFFCSDSSGEQTAVGKILFVK